MIIDIVKIISAGGDGGKGVVSFRREKGVPKGGPDGGNGGNGGSVYLRGDRNLSTLSSFQGRKRFGAERGKDGRGKDQYGKGGRDLVIDAPLGTQALRRGQDGEEVLIGEVMDEEEMLLLSQGGRGGRGNAKFVSSTEQAPYVAESGQKGEVVEWRLELRILADVGIIGKPNAGKSTLLTAATAAGPKIAAYPFTTVDPVLGVATVGWKSFVLAEIPGLLEGAHRGVGLGHKFLRHATRTKVLVHLVDGGIEDVGQAVKEVNSEVEAYGSGLEKKPQVVVVNKMDMPEVSQRRGEIERQLAWVGEPIWFISAASGAGVAELIRELAARLETAEDVPAVVASGSIDVPAVRSRRRVEVRVEDGVFLVSNDVAERLVAGSNLTTWAGRVQVKRRLDRLGVTAALERAGVELGKTVRFGDVELEW